MKSFIGWTGTIVVAFVFAIIITTISTPALALLERTTKIDLIGSSLPKDWIYLVAWVICIFALHWFVFRKRKYKRRSK